MDWKRGLFRLWLVASCVWLFAGPYLMWGGLTAIHQPTAPGAYDCIAKQIETRDPHVCTIERPPPRIDWDARWHTAIALLGLPLAVPIAGWVLFWVTRVCLFITAWVIAGFRGGGKPQN